MQISNRRKQIKKNIFYVTEKNTLKDFRQYRKSSVILSFPQKFYSHQKYTVLAEIKHIS